ncbi:hypothetical protein HYU93_02450 [Candidatus Daviesbacteria bacterium]|nr:hypothetical protein [Candidatus Daviesbacteria bacterium]
MILALFIFFIASLIFTSPLAFNIANSIPGTGAGDGFLYLWNVSIFWQELMSGNNPFFTKMVLYPVGANLLFHDYSPLTNFLLGAFKNNLVLGMNILILIAFTLAGFFTFVLIKVITNNYLLSVIAGLFYSFSPIMFSYLLTEHYYYLFAAPYLPLSILTALKFWQKCEIKYFLQLILIFWLVFFTSYYMSIVYAVMLATFFLTKLLLIKFFRNKTTSLLSVFKVMLSLLVYFIILPILVISLFIINIKGSNEYIAPAGFAANTCNADLAGYIIPNQAVPHLSSLSISLSEIFGYRSGGDTPSYYIGPLYLVLAMIALVKYRDNSNSVAISIVGIIILLLASGTKIQVGRNILLEEIYTPFYWFSKLPFMGFIGCPVRFPIVVSLVVIILSFFLINDFVRKYKIPNIIIFLLLCGLFLLEYGIPKIQLTAISTPQVYQDIARFSDKLSVLELPSGLTETYGYFGYDYSILGLHAMQMYWQTIYKKPRIGGFISRMPQGTYSFFREEPVISDLFKMTNYNNQLTNIRYSKPEVERFIKQFHLGYIIFSPNKKQQEYLQVTENLLGDIPYQKMYKEGFILLRFY